MTQQNQPTLLQQAWLTKKECIGVFNITTLPLGELTRESVVLGLDEVANAATRKAFETILAWLRDDHGGPPDHWMSIPRHTIADELEAQTHPEEAHDA